MVKAPALEKVPVLEQAMAPGLAWGLAQVRAQEPVLPFRSGPGIP
jgi:hypothetical protein